MKLAQMKHSWIKDVTFSPEKIGEITPSEALLLGVTCNGVANSHIDSVTPFRSMIL